MVNVLERLEKWMFGHKARQGQIDIDDGYGATCWHVCLMSKDPDNNDLKVVQLSWADDEELSLSDTINRALDKTQTWIEREH